MENKPRLHGVRSTLCNFKRFYVDGYKSASIMVHKSAVKDQIYVVAELYRGLKCHILFTAMQADNDGRLDGIIFNWECSEPSTGLLERRLVDII